MRATTPHLGGRVWGPRVVPAPSSGRRLKPLGGVCVGKEDRVLLCDSTSRNGRVHSQKTCHHRDFSSARRQPENPA